MDPFLVSGGVAPLQRRGFYYPAMLIVGSDKSKIISDLPEKFLLIDDGELIDALDLPRTKVSRLDLSRDFFNPFPNLDYKKARDFISILDAVFPEGDNTLTKKSSNFALLKALLDRPARLSALLRRNGRGDDPGVLDAHQKIETLLLSPVLKRFLDNRARQTNFSLDGIVLARLDRTVLSDFDCFVIANVLISNFQGHVLVPDFGFYGCKFHTSLIRQGRLRAGVNFLDETPYKNQLLLLRPKIGASCTAKDAEALASYRGLSRGTNIYNAFVNDSIAPTC